MRPASSTPFSLPGRPPRRARRVPTRQAGARAGLAALAIGVALTLGLATAVAGEPRAPADVIRFDLSELDAQGLIGPPSGKRSVDYEFCIPAGEGFAAEVQALDATARFLPGSRGRIGCGPEQVLVLGNTHRPDFAAVLRRLAELPYVERIEQAWFE
jgi:hypothetical protein